MPQRAGWRRGESPAVRPERVQNFLGLAGTDDTRLHPEGCVGLMRINVRDQLPLLDTIGAVAVGVRSVLSGEGASTLSRPGRWALTAGGRDRDRPRPPGGRRARFPTGAAADASQELWGAPAPRRWDMLPYRSWSRRTSSASTNCAMPRP